MMIACPSCGGKVDENANLCPHCAARVQYILSQRKEKKRQERISQNAKEISEIHTEIEKYKKMLLEESKKRPPKDKSNAYCGISGPVCTLLGVLFSVLCIPIFKWFTIIIIFASPIIFTEIYAHILETKFNSFQEERKRRIDEINSQIERLTARLKVLES